MVAGEPIEAGEVRGQGEREVADVSIGVVTGLSRLEKGGHRPTVRRPTARGHRQATLTLIPDTDTASGICGCSSERVRLHDYAECLSARPPAGHLIVFEPRGPASARPNVLRRKGTVDGDTGD